MLHHHQALLTLPHPSTLLTIDVLSFNQHLLIDTTPLPDSIPKVQEVGSSSAPLLSASYFIGARCKAYNDDYMQCKTEANGKGEMDCLREGRKVTRCAGSVYVLILVPVCVGTESHGVVRVRSCVWLVYSRDGVCREVGFDMGYADVCCSTQPRRRQQELSRRVSKALGVPGQQQPAALAMSEVGEASQQLRF